MLYSIKEAIYGEVSFPADLSGIVQSIDKEKTKKGDIHIYIMKDAETADLLPIKCWESYDVLGKKVIAHDVNTHDYKGDVVFVAKKILGGQ